jgi:hypothetical protein
VSVLRRDRRLTSTSGTPSPHTVTERRSAAEGAAVTEGNHQVHAKELARIARATRRVEAEQKQALLERFGNRGRFRFGMAYHHLDHGLDVAGGAEATVRLLVKEGGTLPGWAPYAARLAGLFHDHVQDRGSGRNEDLSVEAAMESLRRHEEFDEDFQRFVAEGIEATKVHAFDFENGRIIQNAERGQPFKAAVADADLGALGSPDSTIQVLGLMVEIQRNELGMAEWATLYDADPDRASAANWLLDQVKVRRNHKYLLDTSARLFAHQHVNADELQLRAESFGRGELTWADLVDLAQPLGVSLVG